VRHVYPRDAMLARVLAVALRLSVCLSLCLCLSVSICLSQVGVLSKGMNGLISLLAWSIDAFSTSPTLRFKEIQVSTQIRVLPSGTIN